MKTEASIILGIYRGLISLKGEEGIPVRLRPASVVGTVQDDPFDRWVERAIRKIAPKNLEIFRSGSLTTPDLVIRDKESDTTIGLEIKKLIQRSNGKDPRGMTIDYNSTLPCGKALINVGGETRIIPCYYLFALLNPASTNIVSLILVDGDFLNYDVSLYKEAKYANMSEYNHGPYGEGSVRHRNMYTYPNPLNAKISTFYLRMCLVLKKEDFKRLPSAKNITEQIIRTDKYGYSFYYLVLDEASSTYNCTNRVLTIRGIFDACKLREVKERVALLPSIPA